MKKKKKAKGKKQKAKGKSEKERFAIFEFKNAAKPHPNDFCLLVFAFCLLPFSV